MGLGRTLAVVALLLAVAVGYQLNGPANGPATKLGTAKMVEARDVPVFDAILSEFGGVVGRDLEAYRNHCLRVLNFVARLRPELDERETRLVAVALAFHDLGLWTANTVDYIPPSAKLARDWAEANRLPPRDAQLVVAMVEEHHKITPYTHASLVETFRLADLADFSLGLLPSGIPRQEIQAVKRAFPNAGFPVRLVELASAWFVRNPTNPAPMMRW